MSVEYNVLEFRILTRHHGLESSLNCYIKMIWPSFLVCLTNLVFPKRQLCTFIPALPCQTVCLKIPLASNSPPPLANPNYWV